MRRPWYRHTIYAPGIYCGYGVKTLPGIREAIEERFWAEADSEIVRVANFLNGESRSSTPPRRNWSRRRAD